MSIETIIKGVALSLESDPRLFSPQAIDKGTLAMLSKTEFLETDKVLDLGCGCGVVGILAAKILSPDQVLLSDIDSLAVAVATRNAERNGIDKLNVVQSDVLSNISQKDFTLILNNPPYHTDFSVARRIIEGSFRHLVLGGRLLMVTKRLDWYRNKLRSIFGNVRVDEVDGYYVFTAVKRREDIPRKEKAAPGLSKKLARKEALKKRKKK